MDYVKDPIQVAYYERILKRRLTDDEKMGETAVYTNGQKIYLSLEDIHFPYGFMSETQLTSFYATRKK